MNVAIRKPVFMDYDLSIPSIPNITNQMFHNIVETHPH